MQIEEIFGFLVLLWYSPLLQTVGKMFNCYEDPELGWVLTIDPDVTCEEGPSRSIMRIHAVIICVVVGVGLPGEKRDEVEGIVDFGHYLIPHATSPVTIFWHTRRLRDAGQLRADSLLASVFEYYTPSVPYFESIHLLRKGFLILFVSTLSAPITQSLCNLVVNGAFLLILEHKQVSLK